jgi:drebrin-like protein
MKRVEAASGSKYSAQKETARKFEPIAPVGTNYTPVGKVDIGALRKAPTPGAGASVPKPPMPSAPRPSYGTSSAGAPASFNAPTTGRAPADAWDEPPTPAAPPPPPAASRPPVITSARPTASASTPTCHFLPSLILFYFMLW